MPEPLTATNAAKLVNQFDKFIDAKYFLRNPYRSLVESKVFETEQGEIPTVVSLSGELPTTYPTDLAKLNITNGPGASGDVVRKTLAIGQEDRTYQLEVHAWKSGVINQSDHQWRQEPLKVIMNIKLMMANYAIAHGSDWDRIKNLGMIDNKAVITAAGEFIEVSDTNFSFAGIVTEREATATAGGASTITLDAAASAVDDFYNHPDTGGICIISGLGKGQKRQVLDYDGASKLLTVETPWTIPPDATSVFRILTTKLPVDALDWNITLPDLYNNMGRRGSEDFAIGMSEGLSVYSLSTSPEVKTKLFKTDKQVDIRYFDPSMNFTARGIESSVDGYAPNVDPFILRYDACMNLIHPFENVAQTRGIKGQLIDDYKPVSQGGKAEYEVAFIMTRSIWEGRPRPPEMVNMEGAQFMPQNYTADVHWLNPEGIDAFDDNRLHNKGFFDSQWSKAAKPLNPEFGYSVLQRIPSEIGNTIPKNIG